MTKRVKRKRVASRKVKRKRVAKVSRTKTKRRRAKRVASVMPLPPPPPTPTPPTPPERSAPKPQAENQPLPCERDAKQVRTKSITIEEIMITTEFAMGVDDVRANKPYRPAYETMHTNAQWFYERGRAWALLVSPLMELKRQGKVNPMAMMAYRANGDDIL